MKRSYFNNTDIFFDSEITIYVNRYHENFDSQMHTHDFPEINYVVEGKGFHYINDEVLPVTCGDLFIIPVGTAHVYRPTSVQNSSLVVYNCVFPADQLIRWCQSIPHPVDLELMLSGSTPSYYRYYDSQQEAKTIFDQLYKEFIQHLPGYRTLLITRLIELLILLFRFENAPSVGDLPSTSQRLDTVFSFIKTNYHLSLSLEQMANMVHMSSSHFQRLFKKTTGQSFVEYMQNVRIEESCRLLRTSALKIQDISNRVGYQDTRYFLRLFKKKTGTAPRDYRKKSLQKAP
jgi:AraC-like DNA-binding protein/mannose-6-phosphate isomerase-like protein (cupin superfamily)